MKNHIEPICAKEEFGVTKYTYSIKQLRDWLTEGIGYKNPLILNETKDFSTYAVFDNEGILDGRFYYIINKKTNKVMAWIPRTEQRKGKKLGKKLQKELDDFMWYGKIS